MDSKETELLYDLADARALRDQYLLVQSWLISVALGTWVSAVVAIGLVEVLPDRVFGWWIAVSLAVAVVATGFAIGHYVENRTQVSSSRYSDTRYGPKERFIRAERKYNDYILAREDGK